MTRINIVPPQQLCDQHLLAEYRELPRVFKLSKNNPKAHIPKTYRLGPGHVTFFYDKLKWLRTRHASIVEELSRREFNVKLTEQLSMLEDALENDWMPSEEDTKVNKMRILERLKNMRHIKYKKRYTDAHFFEKMYQI